MKNLRKEETSSAAEKGKGGGEGEKGATLPSHDPLVFLSVLFFFSLSFRCGECLASVSRPDQAVYERDRNSGRKRKAKEGRGMVCCRGRSNRLGVGVLVGVVTSSRGLARSEEQTCEHSKAQRRVRRGLGVIRECMNAVRRECSRGRRGEKKRVLSFFLQYRCPSNGEERKRRKARQRRACA